MKRIIGMLVLLITTATVAAVGPGAAGAAFADKAVLQRNGDGRSAPDAPAAMDVLAGAGPAAPAAPAVSVLWYPTANVWTDSNASAECRALGQQEVASGNWDAYSCRSDPSVSPSAVRLWTGIWVGCPTCIAIKPGGA